MLIAPSSSNACLQLFLLVAVLGIVLVGMVGMGIVLVVAMVGMVTRNPKEKIFMMHSRVKRPVKVVFM